MRRIFSISHHIFRKLFIILGRVFRRSLPTEVLAEEWTERIPKENTKRRLLYLGPKYDYNDRRRGLSYKEYNFLDVLRELPVSIVRIDIYSLADKYGKKAASNVVKEVALREAVDTVFYTHYLDILDYDMLRELRDNPSMKTMIHLADDDVRYKEYASLTTCFNTVITTIKKRHEERKRQGISSVFSQFYANTTIYRNMHMKKEYDVVFIGQKFGTRAENVSFLRKNGIRVEVFGPFWHRNSRLSQMDMIEKINKAKIMLNFSGSSKDMKQKFIKGRVFEILACGTFLLTEDCSDLDLYVKRGKDLVVFNSKKELLEKIRYYLTNEKKRQAIAAHGERSARSKYSYQKEFRRILNF